MSTKIYNGYYLKEKDFAALNQKLKDLSVKMKKLKRDYVDKETAKIFADYVDSYVLFGRTPSVLEDFKGKSVLDFLDAMEKAVDKSHKSRYRSEGNWDLECSVVLYPHASGKIYCQFFQEGVVEGYEKLWKKQPWIEDFHYQNSTDRPSKIPARKWNERRKVWDDIFKGTSSRPVDCGFTFILAGADYPLFEIYHTFKKKLPTKEQRYEAAFTQYADHHYFITEEAKALWAENRWIEALRESKNYRLTNEKTLREAFEKTYGDKFLDLKEVLEKGFEGLTKGHL